MNSNTQLRRLLNLVPYLQQHQGVSVDQVAADFGVLPKQVIRDLEVLQFCGLPEGMYDDLFDVDLPGAESDGHIFFRNGDVLDRPMRLRYSEAASLLLALDMLVEISGGSQETTEARRKIREVIGEVQLPAEVAVSAGDSQQMQLLSRAIAEHRALRLDYLGSGGPSAPVVEPHQLRIVEGFTYLDAWSRTRNAWRSYRLDRIADLVVLEEAFEPRDKPAGDWFDDVESDLTITVTPQAAWVAEYYPISARESLDHGMQVTFPVSSPSWATSLLLRLGDQVVAVEDTQFATQASEEASRALSNYARLGIE